MKILQLGNGGGLDYDKVSSSFLIKSKQDSYLLFDCGYNVVKTLIEKDIDLADIDNVFISHIHEDHIGNLLLLIYTRFFKLGKKTNVFVANEMTYEFMLGYLSRTTSNVFTSSSTEHIEMHNFYSLETSDSRNRLSASMTLDDTKGLIIRPVKGNHKVVESSGLLIAENDKDSSIRLCITGDTKASSLIEAHVREELVEKEATGCVVFHDFSDFNYPSKNVHACANDIEAEYSLEFRESLNFYHTGSENFKNKWIDISSENSVLESGLKLFKGGK